MTVKELKAALAECDDDDFVILAKDSEGNGYSPLYRVSTDDAYAATTTYAGQSTPRRLTPELLEQGYTKEDIMEGVPCITLWPVN